MMHVEEPMCSWERKKGTNEKEKSKQNDIRRNDKQMDGAVQ